MNKAIASRLLSAEVWLISEDPLLATFLADFLHPLRIAVFAEWPQIPRRSKKNRAAVILLDDSVNADSMHLPLLIKSSYPDMPILFLTSRYQLKDRLAILRNGADLCLKKPFAPEELKIYLEKFLSHAKKMRPETTTSLQCESFVLKKKPQQASYQQSPLPLSPFVFELFWFFLQHPNQILSRQEIGQALWGSDCSNHEVRTVDQYVRQLRKALAECTDHTLNLQTHHRKGYALHTAGKVTSSESL